ncbi:hypothetical protein [Candidatus Thioglobus autotrophicus]|nr:hypothetical protein [Candidatus Thioglobus autotrophicus]
MKSFLITCRDYISKFSTRKNLHILTAIIWRISLRKRHNGGYKFKGKKVIILSRLGGNEDVENALKNSIKPYSYYLFPRSLVKHIFTIYLDGLVSDSDYRSATSNIKNKKLLYRKHLSKVLFWFKKLFGLDAFIEFNITYYPEKELAEASKLNKINFILLHKECLMTEKSAKLWVATLKERHLKFHIDGISVYNKISKDAILGSGLSSQSEIVVTGCSRMDLSHNQRLDRQNPVKPKLVYFMIQNTAGITQKQNREGFTKDFESLAKKVTQNLVKIAHEVPNVEFFFKTKTGFSDMQVGLLSDNIPSNIKIVYEGAGHDLLLDASVVVGFNTTAVFEAIASGCQVVSPELFSEVPDSLKDYVFYLGDSAYLPRSSSEFRDIVLDLLEKNKFNKYLSSSKKKLLDDVLGNSDGNSGKRTMKLIEDNI